MKRLALAVAVLALPFEGFAQEVILTPEPAGRASPEYDKRKEMGDWARGILDRAASGEAAPRDEADAHARGCVPPPDHKPHGVVWGEVGTGGYSNVGMVVTQPVGDCSQVTVGISRSDGGRRLRPRVR